IREIHWCEIPATIAPQWANPADTLLALWPSPVDDDCCFTDAGFSEFDDSDEQWDAEWKAMVERMLEALNDFGPAIIHNKGAGVRGRSSLASWVIPWYSPTEAVELSIADRTILSTHDDKFEDAVVDFGELPKVTLRSGQGHPILWTVVNPGG